MKYILLPENKKYYRANLHCHSVLSDGVKTGCACYIASHSEDATELTAEEILHLSGTTDVDLMVAGPPYRKLKKHIIKEVQSIVHNYLYYLVSLCAIG